MRSLILLLLATLLAPTVALTNEELQENYYFSVAVYLNNNNVVYGNYSYFNLTYSVDGVASIDKWQYEDITEPDDSTLLLLDYNDVYGLRQSDVVYNNILNLQATLPRLTEDQLGGYRPYFVEGDLVYNKDRHAYQYWNGTSWVY